MDAHGGNIYDKKIELDYSVNINPLGCPGPVRSAAREALLEVEQYPQYDSLSLRQALAEMESYLPEGILVGNGASELFQAIVGELAPQKALLLSPSFFGYEHALLPANSEIRYYQLKEENEFTLTEDFLGEISKDLDLIILANPNNPTGRRIGEGLLEDIIAECRKKEIYLLIDECFLPFCKEQGNRDFRDFFAKNPQVICVRAFTKLFAIPGIRLGYAMCTEELALRIHRQLPEWNVSVIAQRAGLAACEMLEKEKDESKREKEGPETNYYLAVSRGLIEKERSYLSKELQRLQIQVFDSDANFLLIKSSLPLKELLLEDQILIRDCSNFRGLGPGYYRIAVKTEEENRRFLKKLEMRISQWK